MFCIRTAQVPWMLLSDPNAVGPFSAKRTSPSVFNREVKYDFSRAGPFHTRNLPAISDGDLMSTPTTPVHAPGLTTSLKELAVAGADYLRSRLDLGKAQAKHAGKHYGWIAGVGAALAVFGVFTYFVLVFAAIAGLAAAFDGKLAWLWASLWVFGLHVLILGVLYVVLRKKLKGQALAPSFAETLAAIPTSDPKGDELVAAVAMSKARIDAHKDAVVDQLHVGRRLRGEYQKHPAVWVGSALAAGTLLALLTGRKGGKSQPVKIVYQKPPSSFVGSLLKFAIAVAQPRLIAAFRDRFTHPNGNSSDSVEERVRTQFYPKRF